MFNLRSASKSPFGAQLPQGGIQMPNVDPALMQQAAQSPPRRGLFGGLRDRVMGQREDGSTFRDRLMMAGMALQGDGRGAAAYGANLQEQQRAQQETQQAVEQRRQRMQQAVQLVQNIAPDNRALMNAAMMDPDAVLERYLGNMEASNVSAGSTRINPLTGQDYTAPEMFRQDGLYGTQTPDGVTFNDQDALVREGMAADVASTRAGTQNTRASTANYRSQIEDRAADNARADAEFQRQGTQPNVSTSQEARARVLGEAQGAMQAYRDTLEEVGVRRVYDPADPQIARLEAARTAALMQAKELFNLGVLSGPDLEIIEGAISDVTGRGALRNSTDAALEQLNVLDDYIQRGFNQLPESLRPQAQPARARSGNDDPLGLR